MTLLRVNPRFPTLWRDFDEFFKDFTVPAFAEGGSGERALTPPADIVEKDRAIEIRLDLPGMDANDIDVKVDGNMLTISATRKNEKSVEEKGWIRQERSYGQFSRSFSLPSTLDGAKLDAAYRQGVLTVTLPKKEEVQAKSLKVRVEA
jgi:HSP20 family protein